YNASVGKFSSEWKETLVNGVWPDGHLSKNTYQVDDEGKITFDSSQTITNTAAMDADKFEATLTALNTLSDSKVISNPTIVTLNNTEATINVGEEYPIPNYTYNQEQGAFEVSGFEYKPLGVLLKVTPQVNARGFIKLTLEPEVSARGTDSVLFGTAKIPIINTRKTKTQISMKDGYTMGIGGLLSKSDINGSTKVPVLGSIPVIGNLFKSKSKENSMKNLLIFITAKVVNAEGASVNEVFDPEQIRLGNVHERDLPGHRQQGNIFVPPEPPKTHNALRDEIP
ncbi:MAG TPA: type II and III secretion system protein, partial [Opitutaceae bacterium]|nr:type II and III secretion system protein [Opitutaceae bacterium]